MVDQLDACSAAPWEQWMASLLAGLMVAQMAGQLVSAKAALMASGWAALWAVQSVGSLGAQLAVKTGSRMAV